MAIPEACHMSGAFFFFNAYVKAWGATHRS
jgi:hypothetical protein